MRIFIPSQKQRQQKEEKEEDERQFRRPNDWDVSVVLRNFTTRQTFLSHVPRAFLFSFYNLQSVARVREMFLSTVAEIRKKIETDGSFPLNVPRYKMDISKVFFLFLFIQKSVSEFSPVTTGAFYMAADNCNFTADRLNIAESWGKNLCDGFILWKGVT